MQALLSFLMRISGRYTIPLFKYGVCILEDAASLFDLVNPIFCFAYVLRSPFLSFH